jgi:hypothetical protein
LLFLDIVWSRDIGTLVEIDLIAGIMAELVSGSVRGKKSTGGEISEW